jgi:hypothetical protein
MAPMIQPIMQAPAARAGLSQEASIAYIKTVSRPDTETAVPLRLPGMALHQAGPLLKSDLDKDA